MEFENPRVVVMRGDHIPSISRGAVSRSDCPDGSTIDIFLTRFTAGVEDRIVAYTDGVIQSGAGRGVCRTDGATEVWPVCSAQSVAARPRHIGRRAGAPGGVACRDERPVRSQERYELYGSLFQASS